MPAHTRDIVIYKCRNCGKKATVDVYNEVNSCCGSYCRRHGNEWVTQYNKMLEKERKQNA